MIVEEAPPPVTVIAVDLSESMAAIDFELDGNRVTRLDAVKAVVGVSWRTANPASSWRLLVHPSVADEDRAEPLLADLRE